MGTHVSGVGARLRTGFRWWRSEMSWLLGPVAARFGLGTAPVVLIADARNRLREAGDHGSAPMQANDSHASLSPDWRTSCTDRPVTVCLARESVMRFPLVLPASARRNLREAVKFRLLAEAPVNPDTVYFDVRVIGGSGTPGGAASPGLTVDVLLCARTTIDELEAALASAGAASTVIGFSEDGRIPQSHVFMTSHRARGAFAAGRNRWLTVSAVLILLSTAPSIHLGAWWLHTRVQAEIETRKADQGSAIALAEGHARLGAIREALAAQMQPPALGSILDRLAAHLPRTAWLNRVEYGPDSIRISGHAVDPALAARSLETAPGLADVKLVSVSMSEFGADSGLSRFEIHATLREGGPK